jgi:hypothetical protein
MRIAGNLLSGCANVEVSPYGNRAVHAAGQKRGARDAVRGARTDTFALNIVSVGYAIALADQGC